ncbi:MAG: hypothetical protein EOM68_06505 [Spirochaetia bacterium]|nr:hypothetical protein [Spirochaetia bacterium]
MARASDFFQGGLSTIITSTVEKTRHGGQDTSIGTRALYEALVPMLKEKPGLFDAPKKSEKN